MVDAAAAAGADAVKFQTFKAASLVTANAARACYQGEGSQYDMLAALELGHDDFRRLFEHCSAAGIEFISTPFDIQSLDFLLELGVKRLKAGSGDMTNAALLVRMGGAGLPVIISTGMAAMDEIELALGALAFGMIGGEGACIESFRRAYASGEGKAALRRNVTVLHCTTNYPTPPEEANVSAVAGLAGALGMPVGFSDHTLGIEAAVAATALGAVVVEKHFTLDRSLPGPDHAASLMPGELAALVAAVRKTDLLLGEREKRPGNGELLNAPAARKSLVAAKKIAAGESFSEENLTCKRPGGGVSPFLYFDYLGRKAERDYEPDEAID
jgi:N-acetylneuraminate synthase